MACRVFLFGSLLPVFLALPLFGADAPLSARIDQAIAAKTADYAKKAAPVAGDEEFVRRIYLDLIGVIPTIGEAKAFVRDAAPDKRAKLIDRLLARPEFARHMQQTVDVWLMDRRSDKHITRVEWQKYLFDSFAGNKPWDALVREILSADGTDPKLRAPAKFILDRDAEPNLLTRDVSRLFLGMNLTCAQCHDHPLVNTYKQDHYYGLYSFLMRTTVFVEAKPAVLAEKADGEATFSSVFDPAKAIKNAALRLPFGEVVKEPKLEKGKEYRTAPAKGVRPVPEFSRRSQLAPTIVNSRAFARASANRFWSLLLGRGLVQPLDFDHPANPPSHPELLELLTNEMITRKFDLRSFLKEIALSQTYQRSSLLPAGTDIEGDRYLTATLKPLSPEQLAWSLAQGSGQLDADRQALGAKATHEALTTRMAGNVDVFIRTFGNRPGDADPGFTLSIDQTLFLTNGPLLRQWLAPKAGNLPDRLSKLTDPAQATEELYWSVLSRRPNPEEVRDVADYLRLREKDRPVAVQELAWALLVSSEFRFNH